MCVHLRQLLPHFLLHPDQGFQVEEEASLRARWDRASLRLLQETTKRCPQCSVPVERNGEKQLPAPYWTCSQDWLPTMCCLLQVAVCTCSALCVEQSGAGCVESRGTESVWETTGLDDTQTQTFSIFSSLQPVTLPQVVVS